MEIKELAGYSTYQVFLHHELDAATGAYAQLHEEYDRYGPLNEENATPQFAMLAYSVEQKRITVLLLAACCVESVINLWLGLKTSPEQFAVLERATFIEKWTVVPSYFLQKYEFPKDGELYQDLKRLHDRRNALVHLKEEISQGGVVVHEGSLPKVAGDEHQFTLRCKTLPLRLARHLGTHDNSDVMTDVMMPVTFKWPKLK